jgi:hypothetical protein
VREDVLGAERAGEAVLLHVDGATTLLTYSAAATRADGSTYSARFTSLSANRDGRTRLAFHRQTPGPAAAA